MWLINRNLEAMAKQLYDYWFVQFDFPDEGGRPYKSSGGEMVWNERLKREIPKGWEVSKVQSVANTYSGGTPTSTIEEYYKRGTIPWINSGEVNERILVSTQNFITQQGIDNSSAKIYPPESILVAMYGATAGKVSYLSFAACSNQAVCGVIPKDKNMTEYLFFVLSSLCKHYISISSGSARDNISQTTIKDTYLIVPEEKLIALFHKQSLPIFKSLVNTKELITILTAQRDTLLPLLMNGQVAVNSD